MKTLIDIVWGYHVLLLIVLIGIKLSIASGFFQIRKLLAWLKEPFKTDKVKEGISSFQALSTALAGTIGTGNIAGVSLAIAVGGAGAIFWMWISAFFGMMTVFAEVVLSSKFSGKYVGALSYITRVKKGKVLPFIYALGCFFSSLAMGNMAQANAVSSALSDWGASPFVVAIVLAPVIFVLSRGGIKTVARVTEKIVPFMTVLFLSVSIAVLVVCKDKIPMAIEEIMLGAFSLEGGLGGAMFIAMRTGVSRGVFTNEAGLGLSCTAFSNVKNKTAVQLGYLGIFQVFVDTIVMCTITGLCVLVSTTSRSGDYLVRIAYESSLGEFGANSMNLCMALFGFATMTATSYYGKVGLTYISKGKLTKFYPFAFAIATFVGCITTLTRVFEICDIFNALLAIPNLIALNYLFIEVINIIKRDKAKKLTN